MMLIEASWPSKRLAAVTKRTGREGEYGEVAVWGAVCVVAESGAWVGLGIKLKSAFLRIEISR
jgi:hypothetical protein